MTSAPEIGAEIGGYTLESVLGKGGMGVVYLARTPAGALCALKVLSSRVLGTDPSFAARFKREVKYAEALDHPNVLEIYEAGETPDGILFFAMQYVAGADLGELLRRDGALDFSRAVAILGQVADALDFAHARGLVHRDVKPANIIVAEDAAGPRAYLTDFGVSKNPTQDSVALTKMGQMIGTLAYTAPEEILASGPRDHLVDVYSLGCVLYEALVGAPPFVRERDLDVLYAHIGDPRPSAATARPDLPAGIDDVIARAMAIAPSDRYASCAELIAAARALAPGQTEAPAPVTAPSTEQTTPLETLRLVVTSGLGNGRVIDVDDELVLGRVDTLDGLLEADHSISRRHARVSRAPDGTYVVADEHSRNGTFLNGERLDDVRVLRSGDELRIGSTVFLASVPEQAAAPAEPAPGSARLALRLELDPQTGELVVAIENGATVRIVRRDGGWHVEPS